MHMRNTVKDIRQHFKDLLRHKVFVTDKTGVKMLEIVGANFVADEKAIFGNVNYDYVERELDWYKSKSLSVNDIPGGPPAIWKQVEDNGWQYENVLAELRKNPESRRATMIYTRPTMWKDYNHNGRSDFMCTNAVQYMIRNNALHAVVQMRSNDVVFGYKNDYAWQSYVLDNLCLETGVQRGDIHWNVGSLHVYERHFDLVK
jgi:thymidylate synthase